MQTQKTQSSLEGNSRGSHMMQNVRETVTHPIESYPVSTSLLVFGAGLGLGALIGTMIAEASAPQTRRSQAEAVGRSILDTLSSVPSSIRKHVHS